ncbi:isoprenyl transferase [bacterium]|nr:isoprenyl transferase [bacterium]NIN93026.1 isoprenyl transferase [bacterium]NIO18895.1 isoprenyl transferase [bacterium]NIO73976.1 isoprenyl transferase [bacterium]
MDRTRLPQHIAIIMDGNGRWAKKHNRRRIEGHLEGAKAIRRVVRFCGEIGIKILTLFAFSTENWNRPKREIQALMNLLYKFLKEETNNLRKNNIKLVVSGQVERLPSKVRAELSSSIDGTKENSGLILNLALSYGGREEIVRACREIAKQVCNRREKFKDINEQFFNEYLYTSGLPDPDLLIRTSGEFRISNFLLWQIAYSEIYVTPVLWPDFNRRDLLLALIDYQRRERRFGRVKSG